tara:strand:+ start:188 stop:619 length:432 start_codon:yes stop_codon:yes gene_type:complete
MRRIKFTLALIIAILSISFTNFKYSEQEVFNPAFFIAENQWKLSNSIWSESETNKVNDSKVTFQFNINQMYKMVDMKGNQYAGTWTVKQDNPSQETYLILDEGKAIEEKYRILDVNEEEGKLSLEKINSTSGNLNITYVFQAE